MHILHGRHTRASTHPCPVQPRVLSRLYQVPLHQIFTKSTCDETLFPPKCCRRLIDVLPLAPILGADLVHLVEAKRIEFSTQNRVYCQSAECGVFIKPADLGSCQNCHKKTCVSCKKAAHLGDCPEDTELRRVVKLAEQKKWRRCAECNAMVELLHGCNHIM